MVLTVGLLSVMVVVDKVAVDNDAVYGFPVS